MRGEGQPWAGGAGLMGRVCDDGSGPAGGVCVSVSCVSSQALRQLLRVPYERLELFTSAESGETEEHQQHQVMNSFTRRETLLTPGAFAPEEPSHSSYNYCREFPDFGKTEQIWETLYCPGTSESLLKV